MFTEENFQKRLHQQCSDYSLECKGAWMLSPSIFISQIKEKDSGNWSFIFYYDETETKKRDERLMDVVIQLLLVTGTATAQLSEEDDDTVKVFFFDGFIGCPIEYPENALNFATQLFLQVNDKEIPWLDNPKVITY